MFAIFLICTTIPSLIHKNVLSPSETNLLQLELERIFLAFYASFRHQSLLITLLHMAVHLSANGTELFEEDLFRMLRSLRLHEAHNLASLSQVERLPVTNIHLEDVFLRHFGFCLCKEVQIVLLDHGCHRSTVLLDRSGDLLTLSCQSGGLLLVFLFQKLIDLVLRHRKLFDALRNHQVSLRYEFIELSFLDFPDVLVL